MKRSMCVKVQRTSAIVESIQVLSVSSLALPSKNGSSKRDPTKPKNEGNIFDFPDFSEIIRCCALLPGGCRRIIG